MGGVNGGAGRCAGAGAEWAVAGYFGLCVGGEW